MRTAPSRSTPSFRLVLLSIGMPTARPAWVSRCPAVRADRQGREPADHRTGADPAVAAPPALAAPSSTRIGAIATVHHRRVDRGVDRGVAAAAARGRNGAAAGHRRGAQRHVVGAVWFRCPRWSRRSGEGAPQHLLYRHHRSGAVAPAIYGVVATRSASRRPWLGRRCSHVAAVAGARRCKLAACLRFISPCPHHLLTAVGSTSR